MKTIPVVSKRHRDGAMRAIIDHFEASNASYYNADNLYASGAVPKSVDKKRLLSVLKDMGYIDFSWPIKTSDALITLTPSGNTYFENKSDVDSEKRNEWIRYIITTAIAIIALVISVVTLLLQLGLLQLQQS